jgi:hypothetical protein
LPFAVAMEGIKKLFTQKLHCFAAKNVGEIDPGYRYRVNNFNTNSNESMPLCGIIKIR